MPRRRNGARRSATPHSYDGLCLFLCLDNIQESSAHGKSDATLGPLLVGKTCPHPPSCAVSRSYITCPSDFELRCLLVSVQKWEGEENVAPFRDCIVVWRARLQRCLWQCQICPDRHFARLPTLCLCPDMWPSTPLNLDVTRGAEVGSL
ncbi:hypothetical protein V8C44DRAFT_339693 [Trichoderma aethiopicum]